MRNSRFSRAALFASAAVQACAVGPAVARTPAPGAIAGLMLGSRGPPVSPAAAGDAIAGFLVKGTPPHAIARMQAVAAGAARPIRPNEPQPAALPPAPPVAAPVPTAGSRAADPVGNLPPGAAAAPADRSTARVLAADPRFPAPDPQTLLLLLVQLDNLTLTDGLTAYGSADDPLLPVAVAERAHHLIPHSRLEVIPDCGHLAPLDQPEAVSRALSAFLQPTD